MIDSKLPDYDVMISKQIEKDGKSKNFYTTIGAAWSVKKGGISISMDAVPTDGKIVLFPRTEKVTKKATENEAVAS